MQINGRRRLVTNAFLDFMQLLLEREREIQIKREGVRKEGNSLGSIDAHPILVDHATGTQRKVVDYLDAGEQRETEKKTGNASKGYQQIHPTEEHLTLVAYNGPGEELHQHSRHISAIHAEVMKDTYITDIAPIYGISKQTVTYTFISLSILKTVLEQLSSHCRQSLMLVMFSL